MASELLKTFQKIDESRKTLINTARNLGHTVDDNVSFIKLAGFMSEPWKANVPHSDYPDWERPKELPLGANVLANAEIKNDKYAGVFVLVKDVTTTTLCSKGSASGSGCDGYLTSDGVWYDDTSADITHTWDQSKGITVPEGDLAGTYHWFLMYYSNTYSGKPTSSDDIQRSQPVEIIVGTLPYTESHFLCASASYSNLINFEILPDSNVVKLQNPGNVGGKTFLSGMSNLRHISFGPVTYMRSGHLTNTSTQFSFSSPYLKELDFGNVEEISIDTNYYSSGYYGISLNTRSLKRFRCNANVTVTISTVLPYDLEEFYLPNGELRMYSSSAIRPVHWFPQNEKIVIDRLSGLIPHNWTTMGNVKLTTPRTGKTSYSQTVAYGHPTITSIDLNDAYMLGISTEVQ